MKELFASLYARTRVMNWMRAAAGNHGGNAGAGETLGRLKTRQAFGLEVYSGGRRWHRKNEAVWTT